MKDHNTTGMARVRRFSTALLLAASAIMSGCATHYIDTATKEVPVSQFKKSAQPQPVRMSFEFQSDGAPNSMVTELLRKQVTDQVAASGLFSDMVNSPDAGVLSVAINNLKGDTASAAAKGFVTGLTFGLAGSTVTDFYECKVTYLAPGQTQPVTTSARHAIHTTIGAKGAPANATPSLSQEDAVRTMVRQIVSNALFEFSKTVN